MNYYNEIKEKLLQSEIYNKIKDYSKDGNKVKVYFEIGKLLSEAGKEYGKNVIKQYSEKLVLDVGKKYNERTLRIIRQFYEIFSKEKWSTLWTKLNWSHYKEVLTLKDVNAIKYYLNECETKNKLIKSEQLKSNDFIPNPIIIKATSLSEKLTEYTLKQAILTNLDEFLIQLGHVFSYVANEYKIKFDNKYNYIDLLLFNYEYNCFIVIDLKVTEL